MTPHLRDRLSRGKSKRDLIKERIEVRLFGPYAGDCKYILRDIGKRLRKESGIRADICMDLPDSDVLEDLSKTAPDDVYNLHSSYECLETADYAAFLFLKSRQSRFERYGPFTKDNLHMYNRPQYIPQDLNASDVIEFYEWAGRGIPARSRCIVVYEDDVENALGSLVRGIVSDGEIRANSVTTTSRGDTINNLYSAIRGDFEAWLTRNEQYLVSNLLQ